MKIGLWSTTAGSNSSTPPDGAPEGMAPSTVNDTMREMMAQVRAYCQNADFFDHGMSPTFITANSFTVPGNQLTYLTTGRRLQLYCGAAGTIIRNIASASFTVVTTISLAAGTSITNSLSSFAVAVMDPSNPSNTGVPRAWARFSASVGGANVVAAYGVQTISRSSTGVHRLTWRTPFPDAFYCVVPVAITDLGKNTGVTISYAAASCKLSFTDGTGSFMEVNQVSLTVFSQT